MMIKNERFSDVNVTLTSGNNEKGGQELQLNFSGDDLRSLYEWWIRKLNAKVSSSCQFPVGRKKRKRQTNLSAEQEPNDWNEMKSLVLMSESWSQTKHGTEHLWSTKQKKAESNSKWWKWRWPRRKWKACGDTPGSLVINHCAALSSSIAGFGWGGGGRVIRTNQSDDPTQSKALVEYQWADLLLRLVKIIKCRCYSNSEAKKKLTTSRKSSESKICRPVSEQRREKERGSRHPYQIIWLFEP